MRPRALLALSYPCFALLILLIAPRAWACSICGCDPSGGTLGLERPSSGDIRVSLDGRYLQKESGAGAAAEGEKEGRAILRLQYSPIRRLSFGLDVPFYLWKNHYDNTGTEDENAHGFSDLQLGARYEFFQSGGLVPKHNLAVSYALKAPTGNNNYLAPVDIVDGVATYDEHKQLGTGTWDHFVGLWYTYGDYPWVLYAGAQARINGTNSRQFRYGNALFGTLGARYTFFRSLYFSLEAQARNSGKDNSAITGYDPDSGGFLGYATAGVGYQVTESLVARGIIQLPVIYALNGTQGEHPVGFLGFSYDFSTSGP